jgi:hypothetical protein
MASLACQWMMIVAHWQMIKSEASSPHFEPKIQGHCQKATDEDVDT